MRCGGRFGAEHLRWNSSGLGQTNRAMSRAHGHTTADPTVANGTNAQSLTSAVAQCSIIAACTLTGAVTGTE